MTLPVRSKSRPVTPEDDGDNWESLGERLRHIIERNDADALRQFLVLHPAVMGWQCLDHNLPGPITFAAREGALEALRVLLEQRGSHSAPEVGHPNHDLVDHRYCQSFFTPLNAACQAAQIKTVRYLLDLDPPWDLEERDCAGNTPRLSALQADYRRAEQGEEIVRLLLDRGADATAVATLPDPEDKRYEGMVPLWALNGEALKEKQREESIRPDIIAVWSDEKPHLVGATALTEALISASPRVIKWLVEAGARPNPMRLTLGVKDYWTPLDIGCLHHNARGIQTLLELYICRLSDLTTPDAAGQLPLHTAVDYKTLEATSDRASEWLSATPLSTASIQETVAVLLSDYGVCQATVNAKNAAGQTPLHLIAKLPSIPVIRQLLDPGADPSIRDAQGYSLLHILLSSVHPIKYGLYDVVVPESEKDVDEEFIRRLLGLPPNPSDNDNNEAHAERDAQDLLNEAGDKGNTPLHLAANAWMERTIPILLRLGARLDVRNQDGRTPLHRAALFSAPDWHQLDECMATQDRVLALLTDAGGDLDSTPDNGGETPRMVMERSRSKRRRWLEWSVKRKALMDGSWRELRRISELAPELRAQAMMTSRWYGIGRGWGSVGGGFGGMPGGHPDFVPAKRDLLHAATDYFYQREGGWGRGHGPRSTLSEEEFNELTRRFDSLLRDEQ